MTPSTETPAPTDGQTPGRGRDSLQLKIGGMSCSFCVSTIQKAASRLDGVAEASVNLAHEEALVRFDPDLVDPQAIVDAIRDVGYTVRDPRKVAGFEEREAQLKRELNRLRVSGLVTAVGFGLMVAMWVGVREPIFPWMVLTLALIQVIVVGRNILAMAWPSLKRGILNQHVLLEFGALGGLLGGILGFATKTFSVPDFLGASLFITTYHLLSGYTSGYLRTRTSKAVAKLMALQPPTARVVRDGKEVEVPVGEVAVGDRVRVRPGEALSVDGRVVEGSSTVNEALVTGEPVPAEKHAGSEVIGGSINQSGALLVEVTKVGEDSFLSQVTRYVEEARALKPGIIALNDAILAWFVPAVLVAGFGALVLWSVVPLAVVGHSDAARGLFAMLAVAVMGYPCALGMATPLAMIRGGGRAAEKGILMRSGQAFQTFGRVHRIGVDKTGTLTAGKPSVVTVLPAEGVDAFELLRLAGAVEASSEHPLARAVVDHALEAELELPDATAFQSFGGNGVEARVEGCHVVVGKPAFVADRLDTAAPEEFADEAEQAAQTVVWAAAAGTFLGAIGITDAIRPDATNAIAALRQRGMEPYLVTGDNERVARTVADAVGISEVRAGVLPDQKADIVRELQADGTRVAMVGDGINDAPALTQADVGIAIGAGTDIAIESADVILLGERISAVADAYDIATESYRKTKQNLTVALALNSIGVPAAMSGYVNPIWAMVAMVTSVTIVLSNSFGTNLPLTLWKGIKVLLLPELFSYQEDAERDGAGAANAGAVADEVAAGQPAAPPVDATRSAYRVEGVHCGSCVERIEEGVGSLPGVAGVHAGTDGVVVVEGAVPPATVSETLGALGFPVEHVLGAPPGKAAPADGHAGPDYPNTQARGGRDHGI
ncbi:MAG: heavy metal translocating P-type ATPase [Acidimicrobiales bacterium]